MSEIRIVKARPDHFLSIAALDRTAWQSNSHSEFIPDGEHAWRIWCEHALTFVGLDQDGTVVGAVLAFPCIDDSFCLHKVMVAEAWRGRAIGSKLFAALFAELDKKKASCFLTVDPANESAIRLYRNSGFTQEKFVVGYYREHEDRLVLTRTALPI